MKKLWLLLLICLVGCSPQVSINEPGEDTSTGEVEIVETEVVEAPEGFTWQGQGLITPSQNQDPYGTCAIFAAISMFESKLAMETGELLNLSEQQFINETDHWSDSTGVSPEKVLDFLFENGVVKDEVLPYTGIKEEKEVTEKHYKLKSWGEVVLDEFTLEFRVEIIKEYVKTYGPIVTNIALHNDMGEYVSGVYQCDESSGVAGGHWLMIVGWVDDDTIETGGYWICKNSWGTEWGEEGYINIQYNDPCGIDDYIMYYVNKIT